MPEPTTSTAEKHPVVLHIDARFDEVTALIRSGFPDGDLDTHRKVHEGYMQEARDRAALWKSVREKTVTGVVWAMIGFIALACWEYMKAELRK